MPICTSTVDIYIKLTAAHAPTGDGYEYIKYNEDNFYDICPS